MRKRDLLSDLAPLTDEIEPLPQWEREWAQKEYAIGTMLNWISRDLEVRNRVRDHLKSLPPDKPGRRVVIDDVVAYHIVSALRERGHSLQSAYTVISRDGLTAESVKKKYEKGKKIAAKAGKN